jgi:DNA-3-methyladenine glycosylase II
VTDPRAAALAEDAAFLLREIPAFAPAARYAEALRLSLRPAGFPTLLMLILEQQVSVSAAAAMWRRLESLVGPPAPGPVLALDDGAMRACGFSRQKMVYARGLAESVLSGAIDLDGLDRIDDESVIERLSALKGIGRWTAECYLLWALGRRDVLPAADLALQAGWQWLAGAPNRPSEKALRAAAEAWRPRRTAASLLIWAHYLAEVGHRRRARLQVVDA